MHETVTATSYSARTGTVPSSAAPSTLPPWASARTPLLSQPWASSKGRQEQTNLVGVVALSTLGLEDLCALLNVALGHGHVGLWNAHCSMIIDVLVLELPEPFL